MKNNYLVLAILSIFFIATPLFAKEMPIKSRVNANVGASTSMATTDNSKPDIHPKRGILESLKQRFSQEDRKDKNQENQENKAENKGQSKLDIASKQVNHVSQILNATANRLDKIASRIESRIKKIHEGNGSTGQAEALVSAAKVDLVSAKVHITLISSLDFSQSTTTFRENISKIRTEAKAAKDSLTSAKQNLSKAIGEIKGLERNLEVDKQNKKKASTTIEVKASSTIEIN